MLWFLIVVLAVVLVLSLGVLLLVFSSPAGDSLSEQDLIERQVRRAERDLRDVTRDGFVAMLDEARSRAGR
jgi:hypothetical protein